MSSNWKFAVGGIMLYSWALYSIGALFISLNRIICLVIAVMILCLLAAATYGSAKRFGLSHAAVWLFGLVTIAFFLFITNLEPFRAVRTMSIFSLLPRGNLLIVGGRAGWTYLVLVVFLMMVLLRDSLTRNYRKLTDRSGRDTSISSRRTPSPRPTRESRVREVESETSD